MKKTTKPSQDAASPAKGKAKIKNLKLSKETVQLTGQDAAAVKGGKYVAGSGGGGGSRT
jgi:hypothetical protein